MFQELSLTCKYKKMCLLIKRQYQNAICDTMQNERHALPMGRCNLSSPLTKIIYPAKDNTLANMLSQDKELLF